MTYYSVHSNRPDFVKLQYNFLKDKLVVVNNLNNKEIQETCNLLNIKCYNLDPYSSDPSLNHGRGLNFLKTIIDYNQDYAIIDHDLFLYKEFKWPSNKNIVSVLIKNDHGLSHLWPGLIICKKEIVLDDVNFLPNYNLRGDTGCETYKLLEKHKETVFLCSQKVLGKITGDFLPQKSPAIYEIEDFCLHFLNGSSWMNCEDSVKEEKYNLLIETLKNKTQHV